MGNFSKEPKKVLQDTLEKGYMRVRFQQGKPVLDRELNLLGDLASPQRLAEHHFGNGVPADSDGFRISALDVAGNNFTIGAGRCLVDGYEVALAANTTYQTQPHGENVAPFPVGVSNVYLRVFSSEVTGAQDADLNNAGVGDVGFETAIREKAEWEVLVTTAVINTPDHLLLAQIDTGTASVQDRRRTGLTVAAILDEVSLARGSASQLSGRLDASLAPDGALKANSVGSAQIANNAVTTSKIADSAITENKIATAAVTANKIADNAVTQAKIADNVVSIAELKKTSFNGSVSVGPQAETSLYLMGLNSKRHAHLSISAFISGTSGGPNANASISWSDFYQQLPFGGFTLFLRGIRVRNHTGLTVTVNVQAYEVLQN